MWKQESLRKTTDTLSSVCFMGVLVGVFPGGWLCAHSDYCTMGQQTLALVHSSAPIAVAIVLAKLVLGKNEWNPIISGY